jgi:hypothetical protein
MKQTKSYRLIDKDPSRNIVFVEAWPGEGELDLASAFRQIESLHSKRNNNQPWRVVYKDNEKKEWLVSLNHSTWPKTYANWDRRFNPDVKTERWHGLVWDTLKNPELA